MLVIGIAGGTGSGKTTVVQEIVNQLPQDEVVILSQDSYYKDTSTLTFEERVKINFDHPDAIDFKLLVKHLKALKQGATIKQPVYSFVAHNRTSQTITTPAKKVIIVEGILILAHKNLRDLLDLKIFIQVDSDERLIRRLKRDILHRGRDLNEVLERYQNTLKPMHEEFIEPSKMYADLIIPAHKPNEVAVEVLKNIIHQRLL